MKLRIYDIVDKIYHFPTGMPDCGAWIVLAGLNPAKYRVDRFTGTTDKNGVDIYENDRIMRCFRDRSDAWNEMKGRDLGTVKFDEGECQYRVFYIGLNDKIVSDSLAKNYGHVVVTVKE